METEPNKNNHYIFNLPAGDLLAVQREVAEQIPDIIGKSFWDIRAAAGIRGQNPNTDDLAVIDGVAYIQAIGPITRYDTMCTALFGGVSVEALTNQIAQALDSADVNGILLEINSPGGEVTGVADLSDFIYQARSAKPIVAFVDGMAASAAYWIGSAASKMVVSQTGYVGSIGVYSIYEDDSAAQEQAGVKSYQIVSSQSPYKVPNPANEEDRGRIQSRVDALADIFIGAVARNRATTVDNVQTNFGKGDIILASDAIPLGMADAIGNIGDAEKLLRQNKSKFNGGTKVMTKDELRAQEPEAISGIVAEAQAGERTRIQAIEALETVQNMAVAGNVIKAAKYDGKSTAETVALQILQAQKESLAKHAEQMKADAAAIPEVKAGAPANDDEAEISKMASGIAAAQKKLKGVK